MVSDSIKQCFGRTFRLSMDNVQNTWLIPPITATLFAEVIVPLYLPRTLTWSIPSEYQDKIKPGCRVEVQVGKAKRYAGIVKLVHAKAPQNFEPKPILGLLDEEPVLYETQLQLWNWIATYYLCSEGEVMMAALPAHLKLSSETIVQYNDDHGLDLTALSDREYLVAEALELKKELKLGEIQKILDSALVYPVIKKLIDKRVCTVWEALNEKYKEKTESYVLLQPKYRNESELELLLNDWKKSPKQMDLLLAFLHFNKTSGEVIKSSLLKKANASPAILDGLVEKQILLVEKRSIARLPVLPRHIDLSFRLSEKQTSALEAVKQQLEDKKICLLHGVTGSGKTLLYIHLIAEEIKKGNQCLFLLPEIALTSQIIRKLREHLGGHVAVYHSKFNPSERLELWHKVKTGEVQVVLGARSALFLPFRQLSLIITDEEHDTSYKQSDSSPRYHARDAAIYYASLTNGKVLLGSATPSLESYHNSSTGKYGLVKLNERFGELELPDIEVVDLKPIQLRLKQKIIISDELLLAIQQTIAKQKQVIIFQNRRGYTPYQVCTSCGWIPKCTHCDVSLSFHKATGKLHCHYCGSTYPVAQTCAACGNQNFMQKNFGTEQLEEKLEQLLPDVTIARMDTDSVRGKHSHDNLIKQFEQQKIQVLAGTQMVVKGLDFDHVGLVGIPDGDAILHFSDFRVNERAFQLIEQVSGRAGRKGEKGRVVMQLQDTAHPLLPLLSMHDYEGFYNTELQNRHLFFYPPFSRIIVIQCRHTDKAIAHLAMQTLCNWLAIKYEKFLVGPAEPPVSRIRNQYIAECMLKLPKQQYLLHECKQYILQGKIEMQHQPSFKNTTVIIDVDAI
ncbi:MAG: primosomal protein N' [Bacteroidota bacterium]